MPTARRILKLKSINVEDFRRSDDASQESISIGGKNDSLYTELNSTTTSIHSSTDEHRSKKKAINTERLSVLRPASDYINESQNVKLNEKQIISNNYVSRNKTILKSHVSDDFLSTDDNDNEWFMSNCDQIVGLNYAKKEENDTNPSTDLKVEIILACRILTLEDWEIECKCMNTSEIKSGSRWYQDQPDKTNLLDIEKRYLVKWSDLSYLHCSWETKDDLIAETKEINFAYEKFMRLKTAENDYYLNDYKLHPSFYQIDRIINMSSSNEGVHQEVSKKMYSGLILDKDHPNYDRGKERKFLVAWNKHSMTYEYERDLLTNNIDYQEHLEQFLKSSKTKSHSETETKQLNSQEIISPTLIPNQKDKNHEYTNKYMTVGGIGRIKQFQDQAKEEIYIENIIACKTLQLTDWNNICNSINTSEIENGSRWHQDESQTQQDTSKCETRYLVKWLDLSHIHCSWETEHDLVSEIEMAQRKIKSFERKSQDGLLFDLNDRGDGEYFDPCFLKIDRVLQILYPKHNDKDDSTKTALKKETCKYTGKKWIICLDRNDPNYEVGKGRQLLVKWKSLGYSKLSYEFERDLIENKIDYQDSLTSLLQRSKKPTEKMLRRSFLSQQKALDKFKKLFGKQFHSSEKKENKTYQIKEILGSHVFRNGGQLRDYQSEGATWLISNYLNHRSSILADEMGLGKTIQTAAYINMLTSLLKINGPYLIIAPLSTLSHWQRELSSWTHLDTVVYYGNSKERSIIRQLEFVYESDLPSNFTKYEYKSNFLKHCHSKSAPHWQRPWMVQVVITSPEMIIANDFLELEIVPWKVVVIDEAHRLKNHSSKINKVLRQILPNDTPKLLLTGTPIQNNMKELWSLLNIVDPIRFEKFDEFLGKYGDMKNKEVVDRLHKNIRPYILRRLKEDVESSVPPKEETLIEVELTVMQKQYYRALYEKNVNFLHRNHKKPLDGPRLNNLAMQLRKCCNHPFLLNGVEIEARSQSKSITSHENEVDLLVQASGKLVLLDKLLPKLKEGGHRVLIFSHFTNMLNILQDYLYLRKHKMERLDGSITGKQRQLAIDRFQRNCDTDSSFVMLLSTRAGGSGINLTKADTCIIFDSDWNPQADIQAQARCHRIGQTKKVKIYRLLSRKTYEMQMFHRSSLKMGLDHIILHGIGHGASKGNGSMTKEHLEKLLRHGAYDIFNENKAGSSEQESNNFIAQDIDSILERRAKTITHDNTGNKSNLAGGTFSKASFKVTSVASGGIDDVDVDDPDFWKKILGKPKDKLDTSINKHIGKTRKKVNYNTDDYFDKLNVPIDNAIHAIKKRRSNYDEDKFKLEANTFQATKQKPNSSHRKKEKEVLKSEKKLFSQNGEETVLLSLIKKNIMSATNHALRRELSSSNSKMQRNGSTAGSQSLLSISPVQCQPQSMPSYLHSTVNHPQVPIGNKQQTSVRSNEDCIEQIQPENVTNHQLLGRQYQPESFTNQQLLPYQYQPQPTNNQQQYAQYYQPKPVMYYQHYAQYYQPESATKHSCFSQHYQTESRTNHQQLAQHYQQEAVPNYQQLAQHYHPQFLSTEQNYCGGNYQYSTAGHTTSSTLNNIKEQGSDHQFMPQHAVGKDLVFNSSTPIPVYYYPTSLEGQLERTENPI